MNRAGFRSFRDGRQTRRINPFPAGVTASLSLCLIAGPAALASAAPNSPAGLWFTKNEGKVIPDKAAGDRTEFMKILCKTDVFTRTQAVPKSVQPRP